MLNVYLYLRYFVFGIFITSNAIIASVGVWNLSLLQAVAMNFPAVFYLIFVGAFALAFIFTVIFIELARGNSFTSRVFFECSWVSFFFVMELAGAVSFTATVPSSMCSGIVENKIQGSCASTQVLEAFTFILTSTLFGYLLVLLLSCFIRRQHGSELWRCNVYDLASLSSQVAVLTLPRFINRNSPIAAPQPRRPPAELLYSYRFGLSPDYEIEHFQPPVPPIRAASSSLHHKMSEPPTTFYPQAVQATLAPHRRPMVADPHQPVASRSPPPLGDWPRRDILQQPVRTRGVVAPTAASGPETVSSLPPPRRRPTGPRNQANSMDERRPQPLDLSKITTWKDPS